MLEHLFGSVTRVKLLLLFFRSPERCFYVRELARLAETQLNAVRREIANLEKLGVIRAVEKASAEMTEPGKERAKYYTLDINSLVHKELKALVFKAQMLEEQEFVEAIKAKGGEVKYMLLTGTFTNEENAGTDILLVGKIKPLVLTKLIQGLEKNLSKTIRYTVMEEKEFIERQEIGDKFLYGVLEGKHIVVVDTYHK